MRLIPLVAICAGCASVVPSTVARLDGVSPLTMDPAAISVALELPAGVGVAPGGAQLYLGAVRSDTGAETGTRAAMARQDHPELGQVYTVAPDDAAALRAEQDRISAWRAEAPEDTVGTLSVTLAPCRSGAAPAPDATASVALQFDPQEPFRPLLRDVPLDRVTEAAPIASWPPCG